MNTNLKQKSKYNRLLILLLILLLLLVVKFQFFNNKQNQINLPSQNTKTTPAPISAPNPNLANPASENCSKLGGKISFSKDGKGGSYGICFFEDNRQCEEWALLKGDCPVGGRKITGYDNQEEIFCAITGNQVDMNNKKCILKNPNKICDLNLYFNRSCE